MAQYSPLISDRIKKDIYSAGPQQAQIKQRYPPQELPLSELPSFIGGKYKLDVPVYTVWGACEDVRVLEKFRSGEYKVDKLHIIDEANSRLLDVGGVKLRLLGLGGAVVMHKLFDNGDGRTTVAGGQGTMWTTLLQMGELVDTANRVYDPTETRVFVTHASPAREGLLNQLSVTLKADFSISAGLHFRYGSSYNEFSVNPTLDHYRGKLAASKASFNDVWETVKSEVEPAVAQSEAQQILLHNALDLVQKMPSVANGGNPFGGPVQAANAGQVDEGAFKNMWNFNLADAAFGYLVLEIDGGRIGTEMKAQGFNFAHRGGKYGSGHNLGIHDQPQQPQQQQQQQQQQKPLDAPLPYHSISPTEKGAPGAGQPSAANEKPVQSAPNAPQRQESAPPPQQQQQQQQQHQQQPPQHQHQRSTHDSVQQGQTRPSPPGRGNQSPAPPRANQPSPSARNNSQPSGPAGSAASKPSMTPQPSQPNVKVPNTSDAFERGGSAPQQDVRNGANGNDARGPGASIPPGPHDGPPPERKPSTGLFVGYAKDVDACRSAFAEEYRAKITRIDRQPRGAFVVYFATNEEAKAALEHQPLERKKNGESGNLVVRMYQEQSRYSEGSGRWGGSRPRGGGGGGAGGNHGPQGGYRSGGGNGGGVTSDSEGGRGGRANYRGGSRGRSDRPRGGRGGGGGRGGFNNGNNGNSNNNSSSNTGSANGKGTQGGDSATPSTGGGNANNSNGNSQSALAPSSNTASAAVGGGGNNTKPSS